MYVLVDLMQISVWLVNVATIGSVSDMQVNRWLPESVLICVCML